MALCHADFSSGIILSVTVQLAPSAEACTPIHPDTSRPGPVLVSCGCQTFLSRLVYLSFAFQLGKKPIPQSLWHHPGPPKHARHGWRITEDIWLGCLDTGLLSRQPCKSDQPKVNSCGPYPPSGQGIYRSCISLVTEPLASLIFLFLL